MDDCRGVESMLFSRFKSIYLFRSINSVKFQVILLLELNLGAFGALIQNVVTPHVNSDRFSRLVDELVW